MLVAELHCGISPKPAIVAKIDAVEKARVGIAKAAEPVGRLRKKVVGRTDANCREIDGALSPVERKCRGNVDRFQFDVEYLAVLSRLH